MGIRVIVKRTLEGMIRTNDSLLPWTSEDSTHLSESKGGKRSGEIVCRLEAWLETFLVACFSLSY